MDLCLANDLCNVFQFDPQHRWSNNCWLKAKDPQSGPWIIQDNPSNNASVGHKCDYDLTPKQNLNPTGVYPAGKCLH